MSVGVSVNACSCLFVCLFGGLLVWYVARSRVFLLFGWLYGWSFNEPFVVVVVVFVVADVAVVVNVGGGSGGDCSPFKIFSLSFVLLSFFFFFFFPLANSQFCRWLDG